MLKLLLAVLALAAAPALAALPAHAQTPAPPATQHVTESPQVIEGPQTPGNAPSRPAEPALMSNDTVIRMHDAGLSDDLILQTITAQPGRYTTDADSLIALKKAGLSDAVIAGMANKARRQLTSAPVISEVALSPVNEIGVYFKDKKRRLAAYGIRDGPHQIRRLR